MQSKKVYIQSFINEKQFLLLKLQNCYNIFLHSWEFFVLLFLNSIYIRVIYDTLIIKMIHVLVILQLFSALSTSCYTSDKYIYQEFIFVNVEDRLMFALMRSLHWRFKWSIITYCVTIILLHSWSLLGNNSLINYSWCQYLVMVA